MGNGKVKMSRLAVSFSAVVSIAITQQKTHLTRLSLVWICINAQHIETKYILPIHVLSNRMVYSNRATRTKVVAQVML